MDAPKNKSVPGYVLTEAVVQHDYAYVLTEAVVQCSMTVLMYWLKQWCSAA